MPSVSLRLGPKLNLSLLVFILLLGTATAVLVLVGFNRSQDNAAARSREGLEREGRDNLAHIAQQQSYIGALQLAPAAEWGHQSGWFLALKGQTSNPVDVNQLEIAPSGTRFDSSNSRITDLVIPADIPITARVAKDVTESTILDGLFVSLFSDNDTSMIEDPFRPVAIYYISVDGVTRSYPVSAARGGASRPSAELSELHRLVGAQNNPTQKTVWTTPYPDPARDGVVITAYTPIYDETGYRGVVGVDVSLELLKTTVEQLAPTPSGFAFYIDDEGRFLQTKDYDFLSSLGAPGVNAAFRSALDDMLKHNANVTRFEIAGRDYFVAYSPLQSVGGSLALVAPVDELTREAEGVTESIESEGNRTVGFIILMMVLLFLLALGSTAWINRRILLIPIESLVSGTRAVAAGNFNAAIPVKSKDELGDLAASFNRMIQEVRTRNDALIREIAEREQTARMLAEREESTRQIFQSVSDAIFISDMEDRVVDANIAAQDLYGYTLPELRALQPFTVVHPLGTDEAARFIETIAQGHQFGRQGIGVRKDGSTFVSSMFATRAIYFGEPHILSVIRDVTEEVEQQQLLERRVEERTRELSLLLEVSNTVASTLDMQELFALVLDQMADVVPFMGGSVIALEGDELVTQYARGQRSQEGEALPVQRRRFPAAGLRQSFVQLLRGEPVTVANVRGDSDFARDFRWITGDEFNKSFAWIVSWMALPMVHKGRFIGFISLSSDEEGKFGERDASLAMAVANQAAIAIENARLFAEAERRAQEMTALSLVATTLDLEKSVEATLRSVAQRVVESTHAVAASLSTIAADGTLALGGAFGLPEGFFAAIDEGIRLGAPRPNQRALETHKPVVVRNVKEYVERSPAYAHLRNKLSDAEWDTIVIVPMRYGDRDLGTLESYYRAAETPDEREIGLIAAMGRQAATAIENAMLFAQTETRVRQLEALTQIASSFSLELTIPELMDRMAEQVLHATSAVAAAVTLMDGPAGNLHMVGAAGVPEGFADAMDESYRSGGGVATRLAMYDMRTIYQPGLRSERVDDPRYAPARSYLQTASWESTLLAPITYGSEPLGVLMLGYPEGVDPDEEERTFVEAVADQTGLVTENARLYQRASAAAALEERQRLARELHDSVSQALYGIALGARTARRRVGDDGPANVTEPLDYVLSLAEAGLTEMRALIFELRPESIAQEGLVAAIGRQVAATQARYGVRVAADLCDEPDVSLDVKEAVYRIAQESMHNTVKHARATQIDVRLGKEDGCLKLDIIDNGQGFDSSGEFPGHLGLKSMRERARDVGGTFDIESSIGSGTHVTLRVPTA